MLFIRGCKGATIKSLSCTDQIELPFFIKGSGHRFAKFCRSCSLCQLQQLIELKDVDNNETDHLSQITSTSCP